MQGIQPHNLSDNELLRYIYIMGFDKVPPEWIKELVARFANTLDDNK
jgi:hypothetical protein